MEIIMSGFEGTELEWLAGYGDALESICRGEFLAAAGQLKDLKVRAENRLAAGPEYMAPTYELLGVAELATSNKDGATSCLKLAKQYADMIFDEKSINLLNIGIYSAQALMAFTEKNYDTAIAFYEKIDELKEELGDLFNFNPALCIAEMFFSEGRYLDSIDWYIKAASVINDNAVMDSDYYHLAKVQAKVAFAYFLAGDKENALKVLESVAAIREHYNFEYSDLFINCGFLQYGIYVETGEDKKAYTLMNFLVETCRDVYDYESEKTISALCFAASKAMEVHDMSRAVEYLKLAGDYVNTFFQTEEALWINKYLMEISEQQGDKNNQRRYFENLSDIYIEQYTGDYSKDVVFVKSGDRGEAQKRQEKFMEDVNGVTAKYSGNYILWLDEDIKKIENSVFLNPIYSSCRSYVLELFSTKTPIEVPTDVEEDVSVESPAEENESIEMEDGNLGEDLNFQSDNSDQEEDNDDNEGNDEEVEEDYDSGSTNSLDGWQEKVVDLIEGAMYSEAESLLLKVLGRAYAAGAKDMPVTADIFRGLAEISRRKGEEELAVEMEIRAKILAMEI